MTQQKAKVRFLPATQAHKQRGATLIFVAFFLMVLVITLGLAIEVGRLYSAQTELQKATDLAALKVAQYVGGCRTLANTPTLSKEQLTQIAADTVNNNIDGSVTTADITLETGVAKTNDAGLQFLAPNPDGVRPSAVALTVENSGFQPLLGNLFGAVGELRASAGAVNRAVAGIQLGTTLAEVDLDLLGDFLGVNLVVASAGNLADASISLGKLADVHVGLVTDDDLTKITVNQALDNVSRVLESNARTLISTLQQELGNQPLSDILNLVGETGRDISVSVGAIVNAASQLVAANRQSAVHLPLDDVDLPLGLGSLSADLRILQPPQMTIGPAGEYAPGKYYTTVDSSQVALTLHLTLGVPLLLNVNLPLGLLLADGTARLEDIACPTASSPEYEVTVSGETTVVKAGIGTFDENGFDPGTATLLRLLGVPLLQVTNKSISEIGKNGTFEHTFSIASHKALPATHDVSDEIDTGDLATLLTGIQLEPIIGPGLLPLPLGDLLAPINTLLQTTLAPVLAPVLDPILDTLGVSLGSATISVTSVNSNQSSLFCTSYDQCFGNGTNGSQTTGVRSFSPT